LIYNFCGLIIHEKDITKDKRILEIYKKYLGDDYVPDEKFSTLIANHISWADILYLEKKFSPSFIAKASVRKIPFVGKIAWGQKSSFIERKNKDAIEKTVNFINYILYLYKNIEIFYQQKTKRCI
jgi:1-acyl-sn-glycerol-3-phosphate acyltransferase